MSDKKSVRPTVKIFVTTHKKYRMPDDPVYVPMEVGAVINEQADSGASLSSAGYLRDDTGDNISAKNHLYCELTGLYWIWKNLIETADSPDYIGLVHYRRHFGTLRRVRSQDPFDKIITGSELIPMLTKYSVIVPYKRRYFIETLHSHYEHTHYVMHLYETRGIIARRCPEYLEAYDQVLKQTSGHMFNMMIMRRDLLDEYCTWLFGILEELEERIDVSGLSFYQGRYCGRVGEIIFNVWLRYQTQIGRIDSREIKELPYVYMEKIDYPKKINSFLQAKFLHRKYEF